MRGVVLVVVSAVLVVVAVAAMRTGYVEPDPVPSSWRTAGPAALGETSYSVPPGAFAVSPDGDDSAAGDLSAPWRTLGHAVRRAPAGATIVLRGGVYHESVEVFRKRLTIQNHPGEEVWFDGSEVVTGWVRDGAIWRRDGWNVAFDHTDPTAGGGQDWHMVDPAHPMANWPDQLFVDGRQLTQVSGPDQVREGTFAVDYAAQRLYLGSDPEGHEVRATTLDDALFLNQADGSVLRGIGFRRYATPLPLISAVKGYAADLLIENNVFADSAVIGLSINGKRITVRGNSFVGNGQLGFNGHRADDAVISGNISRGNNVERFMKAPVSGGMKITRSNRVTVTGNLAEDNHGPGIWLDESIDGASVTGNLARRNAGHGIHYEISARALIAANVSAANGGHGIYVNEASQARVWNNTVVHNAGRQIYAIDGAREQGDPAMPWNVSGVQVRNNLLAPLTGTREPLIAARDLTERRAASQMADLDHNAYHRPAGDRASLADWADRRRGLDLLRDLAALRAAGQERHGHELSGPLTFGDYGSAVPENLPVGAPLPADVAALFGVAPGERVRVGAPSF